MADPFRKPRGFLQGEGAGQQQQTGGDASTPTTSTPTTQQTMQTANNSRGMERPDRRSQGEQAGDITADALNARRPRPTQPPAGGTGGTGGTGTGGEAPPATPAAGPTTVMDRVNQIVSDPDNPLMKQAQTFGLQQANARGLINSSMAVGAAQDAMYKSAVPIAQADVNAQVSREQTAAQKDIALKQIKSQETLAREQRATQESLAKLSVESQEKIAASSQATQKEIAALDKATQEKIANMNVAQADRANAMSQAANISANYAQEFAAIAANTNIPAATRDLYLKNIAAQRDSDLALLEQLYGLDLVWSSTGTGGQGTVTIAGPTTATPAPSASLPVAAVDAVGSAAGDLTAQERIAARNKNAA